MAFKKQNKVGDTFKIILQNDDAVPETVTDEVYQSYLEVLDEVILGLVGEPTRFVMKRDLSFGAHKQIASEQMGVDGDGKPQIKMGFILEEVRAALVGIENPASLKPEECLIFEKEKGDGLASKALISQLHAMGVAMSLYGARQKVLAPSANQKKI